MNDASAANQPNAIPPAPLPPWAECDWFCIHGYSGGHEPACGWRGRLGEARREHPGSSWLCPRCGGATLLSIPS